MRHTEHAQLKYHSGAVEGLDQNVEDAIVDILSEASVAQLYGRYREAGISSPITTAVPLGLIIYLVSGLARQAVEVEDYW